MSFEWENGFPKGYGHTSLAFLNRCIGLDAAKKGDLDAAHYVVNRCVKPGRIRDLREQHPNATLIPVLGRNKLPLALAQMIGLPIWCNVRLSHAIARKTLNAMQRLLHKPTFSGYVQKNTAYIIVDDVVTQGGTISTLREFIIIHGSRVVAVAALAYAIGSHAITPTKRNIVRFGVKFGETMVFILKMHGIIGTLFELTNSQVKYLLRFASIGNVVRKMEQPVL